MMSSGGGFSFKSQQDAGGALFLVLMGALAFWLAYPLPLGSLRAMGPGMLPKSVAVIVMGLGLILLVQAVRASGPDLEKWNWRGVSFIVLGICLFGMAIRGFEIGPVNVPSLGLVVAGPVMVLVAGRADPETRWKELIIFAILMTLLCGLMFKYALGLPIPLAPWLLNT
jgi:Tripartite tricarboxylate transporter TctB family